MARPSRSAAIEDPDVVLIVIGAANLLGRPKAASRIEQFSREGYDDRKSNEKLDFKLTKI